MRPDFNKTPGLVTCPICLKKGRSVILGRKIKDGFTIRKYHDYKGETIILSKNFGVVCGRCGELIFFQKGGL